MLVKNDEFASPSYEDVIDDTAVNFSDFNANLVELKPKDRLNYLTQIANTFCLNCGELLPQTDWAECSCLRKASTMTIKIGYFQVDTSNGTGYICVALKRPPKGENEKQAHFAGFAFCSPKDKFQKHLARQIATERLEKWRSGKNRVEFFTQNSPTQKAMVDALSALMVQGKIVPGWVVRSANAKKIRPGLSQRIRK